MLQLSLTHSAILWMNNTQRRLPLHADMNETLIFRYDMIGLGHYPSPLR